MFLRLLTFVLFGSTVAHANIVGTHLQNFNPTSNGLDFVTVQSTRTLDPGILNFMLFGNYATNSLSYFRQGNTGTAKLPEPGDSLISTNLGVGLGIMKGWDVGVSMSVINSQSVENNSIPNLALYKEEGVTGYNINTKIRLMNEEKWALAVIGSASFDNIGNNPFVGDGSGPTLNAELAFTYDISDRLLWGFNLGYRMSDDGSPVALFPTLKPIGDQLIYSTALSYYMTDWDSAIIFELYGSDPQDAVELSTDRKENNLEALLGIRYDWSQRFALHGGIGTELMHGLATPDFRIYAGLHIQLGPLWSQSSSNDSDNDGDGLNNDDEIRRGTDPNNPDSDSDGLSDGGEVNNHKTNPLDPDTDNGGTNDGIEVDRGTNPIDNPDDDKVQSTFGDDDDQDGLGNNEEAERGTDPNNPDSDGDGLQDGPEVNVHGTDPLDPDTDHGGTNDGIEVDRGTNPVDNPDDDKVEQPARTIILQRVNFITNTAIMTKPSRRRLQRTIDELLTIRGEIRRITVEGHTDSRGKRAYNMRLSRKRARAIRKVLSNELDMDINDIKAVGLGESEPRASNKTARGRLKNRRVELKLYK